MCGIAGRFDPILLPEDPCWRERADSLLAHRGPDGSGHFADAFCELVHRRLALIDLTPSGDQPLPNEDGSIQVVLNGEIYNHKSLRSDLKARGHIFRGSSDTEVLAHLYEECGSDVVRHLRGMFAFAIYDRRRRRLMLARDRFGIKPLYYTTANGQLVFASEIKAILAVDGLTPTIDRQACYDYLSLGYIPEPRTGFAEVASLPPGTSLSVDGEGRHMANFHHLKAEIRPDLELQKATTIASGLLLDAAMAQSIADVPVAALLSGGIDSSLVVAAYCRSTGAAPATFNVQFPDAGYDETEMATAVSRSYGTRHKTVALSDCTVDADTVIRLLRHFDQPFADTSLIPTYWIARTVRDFGFICTLSGDGGDEAFGGYACFWRAAKLARLMRLPSWLNRGLTFAGHGLEYWTRDLGRQVCKAVHVAQTGQTDSAALIAGLASYLTGPQKQDLVASGARESLQEVDRCFGRYDPPATYDVEEISVRMTESLFSVGLPADMLRKVDMMSMLAGVEVRVPMLDENVVALGLSLPHRLKADGRSGKLVLRSLAERWLPRRVSAHRKQGFGIPLDVMVNDRFHQVLEDFLLVPDARIAAFANMRVVAQWLKWFRNSRTAPEVGTVSREGLYQRIIFLLSLELWLRDHKLAW